MCIHTICIYARIEYILRTSHLQRDTLRIFRPVCIFFFCSAAAQSHSPFPSLSHFLVMRRSRSVSLFILYFIWFAHVQLQWSKMPLKSSAFNTVHIREHRIIREYIASHSIPFHSMHSIHTKLLHAAFMRFGITYSHTVNGPNFANTSSATATAHMSPYLRL